MYCLLVPSEISLTRCLMTTCDTGIFHILVQIVVMNLQHTLVFSLILTLVTVKHVSLIDASDELVKESD